MKRVLIGSPIKQKAKILKEFLLSLNELEKGGLEVHYLFIDDNIELESKKILEDFSNKNKNVNIIDSKKFFSDNQEYNTTSDTHIWKKELIKRITDYKNAIIDFAVKNKCDYLFFIDSDIVMNPKTLKHLISRDVDIVSNVFWTSWSEGKMLMPQVWLQDESNCYVNDWDNPLSAEEKKQATIDFVNRVKIPGIYQVGGLGACTLISKKAINGGISFSLIDNVSFWGEDRHFCIRAKALGFNLFVDTVYPAYHIYREKYLLGVSDYKKNGFNLNDKSVIIYNKRNIINKVKNLLSKGGAAILNVKSILIKIKKLKLLKKRVVTSKQDITVSMIVKNEENRYLEDVLKAATKYAKRFVIIDDCSTDNTVKLIEKVLKGKEYKIIVNEKSMFHNEYQLRKKQWKETIKVNPTWILFLDADEILEESFAKKYRYYIDNNDIDLYLFRVFDMWNDKQYREDKYWNNSTYHKFLLRYQPNFKYKFNRKKQHCGRMPKNVSYLPYTNADIRVKHYGWSKESDRQEKYDRYFKLDPSGRYGNIDQYKSIVDKNVNLIKFEEEIE